MPFQVVGHPAYPHRDFSFTPRAMSGASNPPLKDQVCYGVDLSKLGTDSLFMQRKLNLSVLLQFYKEMDKGTFFNKTWFDTLAGTSSFREAIEAGMSEAQIRESWKTGLEKFNDRRRLYLLYEDF
jgi:uncharacterized protein YbbC (DUF1343 family)